MLLLCHSYKPAPLVQNQPTSFSDFIHLLCFCLQSNPTNQDLNTKEAWAKGFTGRGVVVTILDDGIEKDHPDLRSNYVSPRALEGTEVPSSVNRPTNEEVQQSSGLEHSHLTKNC